MSKQILRPDFCVVGAGSGGLSFAAVAAQMGVSVALIERGEMGGDCLNSGCIPSKALIAAANSGYEISRSKSFGWSISGISVNFQKVHDHVHQVISKIAPHDSIERFEKLGVQVIRDEGKFVDPATVETKTHFIKAKRFVIATGSSPFIPPIEGLQDVPFYTNESIFNLIELPSNLVVIGGGPIGIELAQAFHRLGSKVTVLEAFTFLPKDDQDITSKLKNILISEGIDLNEQIKIISVKQAEKETQIYCKTSDGQERKFIASHVIVATGRRANIQNLGLELAGVKFSPRGIEVNENLKTSNSNIYAIGDCIGGYQFTHVASYHAGIVIRNSIFRLGTKVETKAIPWVTYTDPELAHVGFLESQLKNQNIPYKALQMDFDANDRAQTEKRTEGVIKLLVSPKGYVLGVTILGIHAGELIYPWVVAIQNNLKLSAITSSIVPYPTLSDISKTVASSFYTEKIFSPVMKKCVKFITRWLM